jgi:hypothetical protein
MEKTLLTFIIDNTDCYCDICQKSYKELKKLMQENKRYSFRVIKDITGHYLHVDKVEVR